MRVVALGGGHGLAVTLTALRLLGVEPTAIVTVADDGGSSGRLRRDLGLLPPGDLRKAMLALADPTAEVRELFGYRFERGDLAGHNLGNLALAALTDLKGGFQEALEEASRWLRVHGQVLPATLVPVRLCGRVDGRPVEGQVAIGTASGRVESVWLEPGRPAAVPAAVRGRPPGRPGPARPRLDLHLGGAQPARPRAGRRPDRGLAAGLHLQPGGPAGGDHRLRRPRATWPPSSTTAPACGWRPCSASGPGTPPAPPGSCGPSPSSGRRWSTPRWPPTTTPAATTPPAWPPPSRSWRRQRMSSRGEFTVRVKEELAALRPAAPAERRALLAALLRFAATLHIGGTLGPRYTLVLATGSGGVTRLAFWLLHAGYGVRPDFRVREAGALAPRARYELVLADRVERVLTDSGVLDGAGRLSFGVAGGLVRSREAAACFARGAFLGRGSVSAPTRAPHLEIGAPEERTAADLAAILTRLGLPARTGERGPDEHRVVVKGGEAIGRALLVMGAQTAYLAWEDGRIRREVRREAVRLANADHANLRRSVAAAMAQVAAVEQAVARLGWDGLPGRPGRGRRPAPGPSGRQPGRARGYARPAALQGRGAGASPPNRGVDGTSCG